MLQRRRSSLLLLIRLEEIQAVSVLQATDREAEAIDIMSDCTSPNVKN